jgi:hypothetical protein
MRELTLDEFFVYIGKLRSLFTLSLQQSLADLFLLRESRLVATDVSCD